MTSTLYAKKNFSTIEDITFRCPECLKFGHIQRENAQSLSVGSGYKVMCWSCKRQTAKGGKWIS